MDKPTGSKHGIWSDCIKERSSREFKTNTVGKIPPYLSKYFQRINDHIVGNHVVQTKKTSPQDNRHNECGCMVRVGQMCWCRCSTDNEKSGHNPTGRPLDGVFMSRAQCIPERDRIIELSRRTNDWCSIKTSRWCPHLAAAAVAGSGGCCPVGEGGCCPSAAAAALRMPPHQRCGTTAFRSSNAKLFSEREYNVNYWHEELTTELYNLEVNSRKLQAMVWDLENCLQATDVPLSINRQCLQSHQKRMDDDGWYNEVEETLCQEKHVLFKCREKMDDILSRAHAQILRNCEVGRALEFDLSRDYLSKSVDMRQHPLKFNSTRIGFHPGIAETNFSVVTPEIWVRSVRENVRNAKAQSESSLELCKEIEKYIKASHNEMWHRANVVNNSFNARVQLSTADRKRLVIRLDWVNKEWREMKRTMDLMKRSVREKEVAKKLATARAEERERHLNMDICSDTLLNSMKNDVKDLCHAITLVKDKMLETQKKVVDLTNERDSLERQIKIIDHDLIVDTSECMPLRQALVIDSKGGPLTKMDY